MWDLRRRAALVVLAAATVAATTVLAATPAGASTLRPSRVVWGPGSLIAFGTFASETRSRGGIYVVRPDGTGLRRLTTLGGGDSLLQWSPDGGTLLFQDVLGSELELYSIQADGTGLHDLGVGFYGVWSPDGRRIAFERGDGLYVMRADGTGVRRIAAGRYHDAGPPAWSPDGSRLAFVACTAPFLSWPCEHQTGFDVYTVAADGSGRRRVTPASGFPQCLAWSVAGRLAFLTLDRTIAIVQADGSLRTFRPAGCPIAWSPAGRSYAVTDPRGIAFLNADGTGRRRVPVRPDINHAFIAVAWSHDGRSLVVGTRIRTGSLEGRLYVVRADGSGLRRIA